MANNVTTMFLHSILMLFLFAAAAINPLTFGNSCCPSSLTVSGNFPARGGATLQDPGQCQDPVRVALSCATTNGTVKIVARSTASPNGTFTIAAPNADISDIQLTPPAPCCVVLVRPSPTAGYLAAGMRRCEYEACRGVPIAARCVTATFYETCNV